MKNIFRNMNKNCDIFWEYNHIKNIVFSCETIYNEDNEMTKNKQYFKGGFCRGKIHITERLISWKRFSGRA